MFEMIGFQNLKCLILGLVGWKSESKFFVCKTPGLMKEVGQKQRNLPTI